MNNNLKKIVWMMIGIVFLAVMTACSGEDDNQTSGSGDGSTTDGANEQVLNLSKKDRITTMDSSMATDELSFQFLGATMEGLYRLGENAKTVEGIAKDHEESEDGMVWTFHLREDAKWSNGDPVTAEDFVYAWQRTVDPNTGSEYGPYMMKGVIKNAEEVSKGEKAVDELGVTAKDDHTLVVELAKPVPYFESLMTFGTFLPLNKSFVEEQGDDYAQSTDNLVFNGPFKLKDWESTSDSWEMVKNEDYWDADTVEIEKMNYTVVKDPQTAVDLYDTGELDRVQLNSDLVDNYSTNEDYTTRSKPVVYYLKLNQTRNEALANTNIRAAISRAFNKQALADELLNDGSIPANWLIPNDFAPLPEGTEHDGEEIRDVNGELVEYDIEKAQEYWKKGLEELGKDSIELEFLGGDGENAKTMQEYLVNQLETNLEGLTVDLKQVPGKQKLELDSKMDYDIQLSAWGPDYMDPYSFLSLMETDGEYNKMGYSNKEYDQLLTEAQNELAKPGKAAERYNNFIEAEKILFEDAAIAPLYQEYVSLLASPKLKGVITNPIGPTYEYKWASVGEE
ncbi:peptide ABC transporter substrate-binding protein [Virgibacillus halodenitrificans]|uniref:peptide ABC transporter substrate-binding protein n=1 Tax=Virgibacillus halodenitrificans TaxID=1482 RepID=UPI000761B5AC|nr:peptide ABC transporter substrate-binding protein [Virgibacillus halodenitrificans]MCG1027192.1 peptide ABC transporter substrate-binding protein [Virgibacillus halodenitrificans]MCJ0929833.1 peptide ABC transporter substrate-binding protein [Virgibacillus halodenitrificans]